MTARQIHRFSAIATPWGNSTHVIGPKSWENKRVYCLLKVSTKPKEANDDRFVRYKGDLVSCRCRCYRYHQGRCHPDCR